MPKVQLESPHKIEPMIRYDTLGVPGILANNQQDAYFGLGQIHGRHFQYQAGCLWTAAEGKLSERIAATKAHGQLDRWVGRCQLFETATNEVQKLNPVTTSYLKAYLQGYTSTAKRQTIFNTWYKPWCWLTSRAANTQPTLAHLLASTGLSGLLSGCKQQAEMKMLIFALCQAGADRDLLAQWFGRSWPTDWSEETWQSSKHWPLPSDVHLPIQPLGSQAGPASWWQKLRTYCWPQRAHPTTSAISGSNAWAMLQANGQTCQGLLAGDPHLPIDTLPALLHPIRARIGTQAYWLGFAIAGLPLLAIGRNKDLAWSCTYAVGDTIHWTWTSATHRSILGQQYTLQIKPRWHWRAQSFPYWVGPAGEVAWPGLGENQQDWPTCYWPAGQNQLGQTLHHWMALQQSTTVDEAQSHLRYVTSRSLHVVCIDTHQQVGTSQVGLPLQLTKQPAPLWLKPNYTDWHNLVPIRFQQKRHNISRQSKQRAVVLSANQGWPNLRGQSVTPFAQPTYRADSIAKHLWAMPTPDLQQFAQLQQQLRCPQAATLLPLLLQEGVMPNGVWRRLLEQWDGTMGDTDQAARCFTKLVHALYGAFATKLGGNRWQLALEQSAAAVWLAKHLDHDLSQAERWHGPLGQPWRDALAACCAGPLPKPSTTWQMGIVGLGKAIAQIHPACSKPIALKGSLGTIAQGNVVPDGHAHQIIGPAARILTNMEQAALWVAWPGGTDENPYHRGFASMLPSWQRDQYHVLELPSLQESIAPPKRPQIHAPPHLAQAQHTLAPHTKQA